MYTGVTNNLERRLYEHKNGIIEGFTKKYNVHKLVWFDSTSDVYYAIRQEKQIKGWTRAKKNALVQANNPEWKDLSERFVVCHPEQSEGSYNEKEKDSSLRSE